MYLTKAVRINETELDVRTLSTCRQSNNKQHSIIQSYQLIHGLMQTAPVFKLMD